VLVHLNGQLVSHDQARVSPFDHGCLFGDGIYEGLRSFRYNGQRRIIALNRHIRRAQRGLDECRIPFDARVLATLSEQLLEANNLDDAFIYWQVSRGTPDLAAGPVRLRVPRSPMTPALFGYCSPIAPIDWAYPTPAAKTASIQPDTRWHLGHIKSLSLLANVMAAQAAAHACQADEAILVRPAIPTAGPSLAETDLVTEGTFTNIAIVPRQTSASTGAAIFTPDLESTSILNGITRELLLDLPGSPSIVARPITLADLHAADEVLLLGTTTMVTSITHIDGQPIGHGPRRGTPGPVAKALLDKLLTALKTSTDDIPLSHVPEFVA